MNYITLFCLIFFSVSTFAKATKDSNLVDQVHDELSKDIIKLATRLDNFFGTERADDEANSTRIRVYTVSTKLEGETASTEGNIKLQLVLPKTQKRLQLVLESDEEDSDESSTQRAGQPRNITDNKATESTAKKAADATTAALRYIVDTAGIRTSFDAGLRFTSKPQVFYRLRLRKNVPLGKWVFRPVEQIRWVQDEGHSSNTDLDLDKRLSDKWHFRIVNNVFWNDQDYNIELTNGTSWFQTINDKIGLSYNLRVNSSNTPTFAINNYSASIGFRQLLYKKWFFWTIIPAINFPRDRNFHRTPSLTLRFDTILGRI